MPYPPSPLLDKLADLLGPKGFTRDPADLAPWTLDWRGRYQGAAAAMLSPASPEETAALVRLCAAARVPLVPQGGNTSMVGGATPDASGAALIVSTRRMNRIRAIDAAAGTAVAEAGVILANLHEAALAAGRRFPLTLGAKGSATIGGLVSTNAGGTQVLRFGTMRGLVLGIEAVLPDGSLFEGLTALKKDNRGYDLRQLLIGAEGTLGIVTAATPEAGAGDRLARRRLGRAGVERGGDEPAPPSRGVPRRCDRELRAGAEKRARSCPPARRGHPSAARRAGAVERADRGGGADIGAQPRAPALRGPALGAGDGSGRAMPSSPPTRRQADDFWRLRDSISEGEKKDGPAAKHDISVAVEDMADFMTEAAAAVEARFAGTRVNAFGHLGDGNVHFNVRAPEGASEEWLEDEGHRVSAFVHDLVTAAGGSISAEHGIGQMKVAELARLGDPARLGAMRAIKAALDPLDIMNPGKLVPPVGEVQESLA